MVSFEPVKKTHHYIHTGLTDNQSTTILLAVFGSLMIAGMVIGIISASCMNDYREKENKVNLFHGLLRGALFGLIPSFLIAGISAGITDATVANGQQEAIITSSLQSWTHKTYGMNLNKQAAHNLAYEVNSGGSGGRIVAVYNGKPVEVTLTQITGTGGYILMDNKTKEALPIGLKN